MNDRPGLYRSQGRPYFAALETFYDRGLVSSVVKTIKIGKEASAVLCRTGPALDEPLVVAKVHRGRAFRFKNDAVYLEGRSRALSGRINRAIGGDTRFGRDVAGSLWQAHEFEALSVLYQAGVSVPRPIDYSTPTILMQYLGDEDEAAPQLNRLRLSPEDAQRTFDHLMRDIETMLACDLVHGDLSPHNILYWQDQPVIIDLPQAVDPRFNSRARDLFLRDIDNVCRYFGKQEEAWSIGTELWRRYEEGEL
jgi:RIO kinase 1